MPVKSLSLLSGLGDHRLVLRKRHVSCAREYKDGLDELYKRHLVPKGLLDLRQRLYLVVG